MKTKIFKIAQIFVTFGLLALVFYQVGLFSQDGRQKFIEVLKGANFYWLVLSVLVGILINMVSSFKWYMLTNARQLGAGYWRLFSYYLVGQFYNLFLPTSVGGDVVRSYELGKFSGKHADSLASVFVERYTGVLILLLLSGLAVLTKLAVFNVDFVIFSLVLFALLLGFIAWMIFDHRLYHWFRLKVTTYFEFTETLFTKLDKLIKSIDVYKDDTGSIVWAFINSFAFYFVAVVNVYVTALVFQLDVNFVDMLIATPIIMLIMNIPLSIGNIGLMEFAYINVFLLIGYDPSLGLSVAILMRLKSLFDGALGGILHPMFVTKEH